MALEGFHALDPEFLNAKHKSYTLGPQHHTARNRFTASTAYAEPASGWGSIFNAFNGGCGLSRVLGRVQETGMYSSSRIYKSCTAEYCVARLADMTATNGLTSSKVWSTRKP